MAKLAEKLLILGDTASGLLARLHNIMGFNPEPLFSKELQDYKKALVKKFPVLDDAYFKKQAGEAAFAKKAVEITTTLGDYYKTFIFLLNFKDEAWKAIVEGAQQILQLDFALNVDLLEYYLDLVSRYVNVHLLVNRIKERKLILASYARAYHITSGNPDPYFHQIGALLDKYEKDEIKTLIDDFLPVERRIGDTLMGFIKPIANWSEVKHMVEKRVFNVVTDPKNMCLPTGENNHLEVMHVVRMKQWVMLLFLVCPGVLTRDGAVDLLFECLKESYLLPIYRDVVFNVHEEYEKLFGWYKKDKFKLSKFKKPLRAFTDWEKMQFAHHILRVYLRVEMETLIRFFNEFPGTLAPKLQMVFGAMHLGRDEVLWYFRHCDFMHKGKKAPLKPDNRITDLIYLTYRLDDLVRQHRKSIQSYYLEFLNVQDMKLLGPIFTEFYADARVDSATRRLIHTIIEALKDKSVGESFEGVRLNWYRASASLSSLQAGVKPNETARISQAMTRIIMHTRNVDCIDSQLKTHGSFRALYWYRPLLQTLLKDCLSGQGNARNALSIIQCLGHALDNVHRLCPEEQAVIGKASVNLANEFLRNLITGVEQLVASVSKAISSLRAQTSIDGVVQRVGKDLATNSTPLPGYESRLASDKEASKLKAWKRALGQICAGMQEVEKIVVYNIEFCPREYLFESISRVLRSNLRAACLVQAKTGGNAIQRPSVALNRFKDVIYSFQHIESFIAVDVSTLVREVLLHEFSDLKCGVVGSSIYKEAGIAAAAGVPAAAPAAAGVAAPGAVPGAAGVEEKEQKLPMIQLYSQWFRELFKQFVSEQYGMIYSPVRQSFIGIKVIRNNQEQVLLDAECKMDVNELRALCTMIGPYGVRVLEKDLLQIVVSNVGTIREVVQKSIPILEGVKGKFWQKDIWINARKKLAEPELEKLLSRAIIVGCVLVFRQQLRNALHDVVQTAVPFIHSTVQLASAHVHDLWKISPPALAPLDVLSADCGIDVGENDHSLNETLLKYKTNPTDAAVWALLPEMFAMTMTCAKLKGANYRIETEGYANNANTMVWTIRSLIACFNSIPIGSPEPSHVVDGRIQQDFETFIQAASYSLIHNARSGGLAQTQEAMVLLEEFILTSRERLQLSVLEDLFPFTLLRTNFIKIYEQQTKKGRRYAIEEEEKEGQ